MFLTEVKIIRISFNSKNLSQVKRKIISKKTKVNASKNRFFLTNKSYLRILCTFCIIYSYVMFVTSFPLKLYDFLLMLKQCISILVIVLLQNYFSNIFSYIVITNYKNYLF